MSADVQSQHIRPAWPVVGEAIPDTQCVRYALFPKQARQALIASPQGIVATHGQNDIDAAQSLEPTRLVLARDELARIVEVHSVIVVIASESPNVTQPAHTDRAA